MGTFCVLSADLPCNSFVAVDEAGRGSLAGPLVVGASYWEKEPHGEKKDPGFQDSKALNALKREALVQLVEQSVTSSFKKAFFEAPQAAFQPLMLPKERVKITHPHESSFWVLKQFEIGIQRASALDEWGLSWSLGAALQDAILPFPPFEAYLIDGSHPFQISKDEANKTQFLCIKGDERLKPISLSSLIAKVYRDRWMIQLGKTSPFSFEQHKGYGTKKHREELEKFALTPLHRRSFLKKNFLHLLEKSKMMPK